jgi:hypothetical protein
MNTFASFKMNNLIQTVFVVLANQAAVLDAS